MLRRYAWLIPAAYGLLLLSAGLVWLLTGRPFDLNTYARLIGEPWPNFVDAQAPTTIRLITTLFRLVGGNTAILAGGLLLAISTTAYRSGQLWAWVALWLVPLHAVVDLILVWRAEALTVRALIWDSLLVLLTVTFQLAAHPTRRQTRA